MSNQLTVFNYQDNQIRTKTINNEPYFCGIDVCNALSIKNNRNVIARLKDGVHSMDVIDKLGRKQSMSYIDEANLYKVAFQSRKPQAEPFVNWVCKEVLPAIRKTGVYISPVHSDLGLVPVKPHTRRLPSVKKEIVLSETEHKAIGGIVKKCVAVAVKETLGSFLSPQEPLIAELKPNEKLTKAERKLAEAVVEFGQEKERHGKIKGMIEGAFNSQLSEIAKHVKPV